MNIVIAGVGGQGSLLASKIFGSLFMSRGLDVKVNEVHGMSQRGGSVVTMVRAGSEVHSPLVFPGEADMLVGLEILETARSMNYLSPEGKLFYSTRHIPIPGRGVCGIPSLPGVPVDALALAAQAGNGKCENTVLLGAVSTDMDFSFDEWERAIRSNVKPQHIDVNITAFKLGRDAVLKGVSR